MSFGQNNYSIEFDGNDDYVDCGIIPLSGQEFSFMTWVKLNSIPPFGVIGNVFRNHWGNGNWLRFIVDKPSFNINTNLGAPGEMYSQTSLNVNQWYHITCTYDGDTMKLYLDGILDTQRPYNGVLTTYSSPGDNFYLGSGNSGNSFNEFFDGNIENVSLWTQLLTESDIQEYMNCPPTGTEAGLVGYWNFEEGSGTTAYDLTSNGNNGTINGATYSTDVPVQNCCVATSSTDVITACDSYTWVDGNTYTASTNNPNPTLHTINAGSYYYLPSTLTINAGDVVEWINDGGFHDVNGETNTITGLPYNNPEVFNSPSTSVVGAVIYSHTFTIPGTYEYDCSVGQHAANGMVIGLL